MPKSCLDGYLTEGCATCSDWADGTDGRGIGCACHFPIGDCPHFAKMMKEERKKEHEALVDRLHQHVEQARESHNDNLAEDLLWAIGIILEVINGEVDR